MPDITINGEDRSVKADTVAALLKELDLSHRFVVVERNGEAVPRDTYVETPISEGDSIEIVSPVGGG